MPLNFERVREHLDSFAFSSLFIEELGWSRPSSPRPLRVTVNEEPITATMIAQLGGVAVQEIATHDGNIPDAKTKASIHREIAKLHHENLLIFVDRQRTRSEWYWVKREDGRDIARPHPFVRGQPGELFFEKIRPLLFDFDDFKKDDPTVVEVLRRLRLGLDVEKVTKKFYTEFQQQHTVFLELISGISDERQRRWYASVLLNRLMFIWFMQRKGFLGGSPSTNGEGDRDYLEHKLDETRARGKDRYFHDFLKLLFFEGFAKPPEERSAEARERLGHVRYLNGGLFLLHSIEQQNPDIDLPDRAFENLFALFHSYSWNLNDTPGGDPNEINPDVLGYIFEKYINQKAFGAYYTRTEITTYLCEQTIHRLVLDAVNTPENETIRRMPGKNYDFKSIGDLLQHLDAYLCRRLFFEVLPRLSILDPACGSGAFLVAAMKTLINIYGAVIGQARFAGDADLNRRIAAIEKKHTNIAYYIRKSIITDNLFGVDIMEEAVEIARLRLFLALVASATKIDELEPLPNIDFNLLSGNSLIGLMRVDEKKFDDQQSFIRKSYREVVDDKNRRVSTYRRMSDSQDLRTLRDGIEKLRAEASEALDDILLGEFQALGIRYEEATWDHAKKREGKGKKRPLKLEDIRHLHPFHWGYEFDEIVNQRGGFDAIITNPPWDKLKPDAKEFFEEHSDLVSRHGMTIQEFEDERQRLLDDIEVRDAWMTYLDQFPHQSGWFRRAPDYSHQISEVNGKRTSSDLNLYKLFLERCFRLLRPTGSCGIITSGGLHSDLGTKGLREILFAETRVEACFVLANERYIFDGVHHAQKFCVLVFHKGHSTNEFKAAFRINPREAIAPGELGGFLSNPDQHVAIAVDLIRCFSPDSLSIMEFRSAEDVALAKKFYAHPLLAELREDFWNVRLTSEFHMTNDNKLFKDSPGPDRLPLYEGKMIGQFDHRFAKARYWVNERDGRRALESIAARHGNATGVLDYQRYRFGFRDVASSTNERAMICTVLPQRVFAGNTLNLQMLHPAIPSQFRTVTQREMLVLVAIFNSFICDWIVRLKVAQHLNMFYVYQLPIARISEDHSSFGELLSRAARLVCITDEFENLALEAGIAPSDAVQDPESRSLLRAEIDAIVAHIYGVTETELRHVLAAFPIVPAATKDQVLGVFRVWKPPSDDPMLKMIAAGESLHVEFKSSARWDYKRAMVNKELEHVVVKTIASLMNSDGGTLLIGVADDGTILGLEVDYQTLGKRTNADGYENWLMTRLLESLGKDRTRLLRVTFHSIEGKQICRVDVERSRRPVFAPDLTNVEKLYIRAGNSTRELSVSEALEYCREHFTSPAQEKEAEPAAVRVTPARPSAGQSHLMEPGSIRTTATPNLASHGLFRKPTQPDEVSPVVESPEEKADSRRELSLEETEIEGVLAIIRDVVHGSEAIDREEAIRVIARQLGAERVGSRIRAFIEGALNTASRRWIIYSDQNGLRPYCRTIDDYKRDDLKAVLRAIVTTWTDEDEAIRSAARYLGFQRAGSRIQKAFKSAINGLIRKDEMERDGRAIRRKMR